MAILIQHFPVKTLLAFAAISRCVDVSALTTAALGGSSMWQILQAEPPVRAWKIIFGDEGERGEYMDGYSQQSMLQRCQEDYKWGELNMALEREKMMSHMYSNEALWEHVCMVAFAEHYLTEDPFDAFQRQKGSRPIFSGVVLNDWQAYDESGVQHKLKELKQKGIDYVRLECNFGLAEEIGGAEQLDKSLFHRLAQATRECQKQEMVPLVLIQVPWREPGDSIDYFGHAMNNFAGAVRIAGVEPQKMLLETRPPISISAREERGLTSKSRISLGVRTGQRMFDAIQEAFDGDTIAGFCVAGGSTKGDNPTAMEDDTQNAVRQGLRQNAQQQWGYELCFWEMGAKLMLQPKVGRLWGANAQAGHDAARELFCVNAKDLADEIKTSLPV